MANAVYPCIPESRLHELLRLSYNCCPIEPSKTEKEKEKVGNGCNVNATVYPLYEAFVSGDQLFRWNAQLCAYVGHTIQAPNLSKALIPHVHPPYEVARDRSSDAEVQVNDCPKPTSEHHDPIPLHYTHHPSANPVLSIHQRAHMPEASARSRNISENGYPPDSSPSSCLGSPKANVKQCSFQYLNEGINSSSSSSARSSDSSSSASTSPENNMPTTAYDRHARFLSILDHLETSSQAHCPFFADVEDALSILEVAHQNKAKEVIAACTNYLSASSWSKGDEAQILMFFKRRKHITCSGALLKRLKMNLCSGAESCIEIMRRNASTLLSSIFDSYDNNWFSRDELVHLVKVGFSERATESIRKAIYGELYKKWGEVLPQLHRRGHVRDVHRPWIWLTKLLIKHGMGDEVVETLSRGEMGLARIREVIALEYAGMPEALDVFDEMVKSILKSVMEGVAALPNEGSRLNLARAATRALSLYKPRNKGRVDKLHAGCESVLKTYLNDLPIDDTAAFEKSWQSLCKELDCPSPWPDLCDLISGWRLIRGTSSLSNLL